MNKLTLKDNLSLQTQLLKIKGEAVLLQNDKSGLRQKQGKIPDGDTGASSFQPSSSQKEKRDYGLKEMSAQEKRDREKAKELFYETKAWLESTFPEAINFKDPKPLAIGTSDLLLASSSPYSKTQLRKCLGSYCARKAYLEAVTQGDWRYDLKGEKAEAIIQEHKDHAAKQLAAIKDKFKNRKRCLNKKKQGTRKHNKREAPILGGLKR